MSEESSKRNTWQSVAALACFVGSVLSLGVGFVLTTGWLLNAQRHPVVHGVGLVLLIVGIPILILGGHFLDLMERKVKKSDRDLYAQKSGGTKPLHVVIALLGFLCAPYFFHAKVNAQQVFNHPGIPVESSVSLYEAQFIVWRTLRRRHLENLERRRNFKLLHGDGDASLLHAGRNDVNRLIGNPVHSHTSLRTHGR